MSSFYDTNARPEEGQRVRITHLGDVKGFLVDKKYMEGRRPSLGVINQEVPGHGGDVWFVEHDNGGIAAYCVDEMEPA